MRRSARPVEWRETLIVGVLAAAGLFLLLALLTTRPEPASASPAFQARGGPVILPGDTFTRILVVQAAAFGALAAVATRLLRRATPDSGFAVILLLVTCEFVVIVAPLLTVSFFFTALWPRVLIANLLAAACTVGYFRRRYPGLDVRP